MYGDEEQDEVGAAHSEQPAVPLGKHTFEFSEREEAIARGEDPDSVGKAAPEGSAAESAAEDDSDQGSETTTPVVPAGRSDKDSSARGKDAAAHWFSDADVELAEGLMLDRAELESFSSRDEFLRAARLLERRGLLNAASAKAGPTAQSAQSQSAQQTDKVSVDGTKASAEPTKAGKLDRAKFAAEGYGEQELALIDTVNRLIDENARLNEQFEGKNKELSTWQEQASATAKQQELNQFHDMADTLEESLFGRSLDKDGNVVQLSPEHYTAREWLFRANEHVRDMCRSAVEQSGGQLKMPSEKAILQRAKMLVFGEHIVRQEKAAHERRISEQSKRRRPAGARPAGLGGGGEKSASRVRSSMTDEDRVSVLASDKDIAAAWDRMQEENGSV